MLPKNTNRENQPWPPHILQIILWLKETLRKKTIVELLRFSLLLFSIHLLFTAAMGRFSLLNPLDPLPLTLLGISFCVYVLIPIFAVITHWKNQKKVKAVARELDRNNTHLYDGFQTILSLENHSLDTLLALNELYGKKTGLFNPLQFKFPKWLYGLITLAVSVWLIVGWTSLQFSDFSQRIVRPFSVLHNLPRLSVYFEDPPRNLGMGDSLHLKVRYDNYQEGQPIYAHVIVENSETRYPISVVGHSSEFHYGPVEKNIRVHVSGDNGSSEKLDIRVRQRPYLRSTQVVVTPPSYTGRPSDTLPVGMLEFAVLPNSKVDWVFTANRKIYQWIWGEKFSGDSAFQNDEAHSFAEETEYHKSVQWNLSKKEWNKYPVHYQIQIEDKYGIKNSPAVTGAVKLLRDKPPKIKVLTPQNGELIDKSRKIPIALQLEDDYGVRSLTLEYKIWSDGMVKDSSRIKVSRWLKNLEQQTLSTEWELQMGLFPDNELEFYFKVCDGDPFGPNCSSSQIIKMRFPTVQEIIAKTEEAEKKALASLKGALSKQKLVNQKLDQLSEEPSLENAFGSMYEMRKIMSTDPMNLLRAGQSSKENLRQKSKQEKSGVTGSDVNVLEKKLQTFKKNIPSNDIFSKDKEEQLKSLEQLHKSEKQVLEQLKKIHEKEKKRSETPSELEPLVDEFGKNLERQEDLKEYLSSQQKMEEYREEVQQQALEGQEQILEEMDDAIESLQKFVQESMEKDLFDEAMLEKLERVQELLDEVMTDSMRNKMEEKMAGQQIEASDLQKSMEELLDQREAFEQNINRALKMLEKLREARKLKEWEAMAQELAEQEKKLSEKWEEVGQDSKADKSVIPGLDHRMKQEQESIKKRTDDLLKKMQESQMSFPKSVQTAIEEKSIQKEMDKAMGSNDTKQSQEHAKKAATQLKTLSMDLGEMAAQMEQKSFSLDKKLIERLIQESLQLSEMQEVIRHSESRRREAGWESDRGNLFSASRQVAQWVFQTLKKMGEENPFISPYLLSQSQLLSDQLKELSENYTNRDAQTAIKYNHNVTRELIKLLNQSMMASSGSSGGEGQEEGGEGSNSSSGSGEGLMQNIEGVSGKQLALNHATRKLLKAMMEGRMQGSESGGQKSGKGNSEGGNETSQGLANEQGQLGDQLEGMAESLPGGNSASSKLRQLAEEARSIEEQLRRGNPQGVVQRQEQLNTRLLETARSLKERGFSEEREGRINRKKDWRKGPKNSPYQTEWKVLIEKELKQIRGLDLEKSQKKSLESYFKELLTN